MSKHVSPAKIEWKKDKKLLNQKLFLVKHFFTIKVASKQV